MGIQLEMFEEPTNRDKKIVDAINLLEKVTKNLRKAEILFDKLYNKKK